MICSGVRVQISLPSPLEMRLVTISTLIDMSTTNDIAIKKSSKANSELASNLEVNLKTTIAPEIVHKHIDIV